MVQRKCSVSLPDQEVHNSPLVQRREKEGGHHSRNARLGEQELKENPPPELNGTVFFHHSVGVCECERRINVSGISTQKSRQNSMSFIQHESHPFCFDSQLMKDE